MLVEDTEERRALRSTVRSYLEEAAPPDWVRGRHGRPVRAGDPAWSGFAGLGVLGCLVPSEHGGLDLGMSDLGGVLQELGRGAFPGAFVGTAVSTVSAVLLAGSTEDAKDLLPDLAAGSFVAALAVLEDGQGYAWATPLTHSRDGRLTGVKRHVAGGACADRFVVSARDDDGLGLYLVDRDADGVTVEPEPSMDLSATPGLLRLQGAPARRLGTGDATQALSVTIDRSVAALTADALGAAYRAMELALQHARTREQFGRPVGAFQAVQHLCTDMFTLLELGRGGVEHALAALDAGDALLAHEATTMAAAWGGDAFPRVGVMAVQVLGGIGFTWEHDVGLLYKRLLGYEAAVGGAAEHLAALADLLISRDAPRVP